MAESFGAERFTSLMVCVHEGDWKVMVGQQADRQTAVLFLGLDMGDDLRRETVALVADGGVMPQIADDELM